MEFLTALSPMCMIGNPLCIVECCAIIRLYHFFHMNMLNLFGIAKFSVVLLKGDQLTIPCCERDSNICP